MYTSVVRLSAHLYIRVSLNRLWGDVTQQRTHKSVIFAVVDANF